MEEFFQSFVVLPNLLNNNILSMLFERTDVTIKRLGVENKIKLIKRFRKKRRLLVW